MIVIILKMFFVLAIWLFISLALECMIPKLENINVKEYEERKFIFVPLIKNLISGPFVLLKLLKK